MMVTHSEDVGQLRSRPVLHDFSEPDFVFDGRIVPPRPELEGVIFGLAHSAFVGRIVASYFMYRLPEPFPWLLVARGPHALRAVIIGPRTTIELDSLPPWTTEMYGVIFRPGAMGALLGMPTAEITNVSLDLDDVMPGAGRQLCEAFDEARNREERLVVLERVVLALAQRNRSTPLAVRIANALTGCIAIPRVEELEHIAGFSQRQLRRHFERDLGLSPKRYLRLMRFTRVIDRLRRRSKPDWRTLALDLGYADQAHFITEFRGFTGQSPTAFLADASVGHALRHGAVPRLRPGQ